MPTFYNENTGDIQTSLPQLQVVDNKPSNALGNAVATLGSAAIEGYKTNVKYQAKNSMEGVLTKVQEDLAIAEENGTVGEVLNSSFDEMAKVNPDIEMYRSTLGNFQTVKQQRTGVLALIQLRAEAELKKTIRKAPGMRKEITSIASGILGNDPNGALVNTLLSSLKQDTAAKSKTPQQKWAENVMTNLSSAGYTPAFLPDGTPDAAKNASAWARHVNSEEAIKAKESVASKTKEEELDLLSEKISMYEQKVYHNLEPIIDTYTPIINNLSSNEELEVFMTEVIPGLKELEMSVENSVGELHIGMNPTANGREFLNNNIDSTKKRVLAPITRLLEGGDINIVKQKLQLHEVFTKQLKMTLEESNDTIGMLSAVAPGVLQRLLPIALAGSGKDLATTSDGLFKAMGELNVDDLKKADMRSFSKLITQDNYFDTLSPEDKLKSSKSALKATKELFNKYDFSSGESGSYDVLARTLGASLQTIGYGDRESKNNFTGMINEQDISSVIKNIEKNAENGKVKGAVMADNINVYLYDYARRNMIPDISDSKNHPLHKGGIKFTFDTSTGILSSSEAPSNFGRRIDSEYMKTIETANINKSVKNFNNTMETLYSLREYSPELQKLSKSQFVQTLFKRDLKGAGFSFKGEEYTPVSSPIKEEPNVPTLVEVMRDALTEMRQVSREL